MVSISTPIIVKNLVKLGYPLDKVVYSIENLVDEIVISVDPTSCDDSLDYVHDLLLEVNSRKNMAKVKVIYSIWDLSNINSEGTEFSRQTNIAIEECTGDWVMSLQADEACHEKDFDRIKELISSGVSDAYCFERLYFYGDIDTIRVDWNANITRLYKKGSWESSGDGMNSCSVNGSDTKYIDDVKIYHYSRIGDPDLISKRILSLDKLFHGKEKLLDENELEPYKFNTHNFDCMHKPGVDLGREKVTANFNVYTGTHPTPFVGYKG